VFWRKKGKQQNPSTQGSGALSGGKPGREVRQNTGHDQGMKREEEAESRRRRCGGEAEKRF